MSYSTVPLQVCAAADVPTPEAGRGFLFIDVDDKNIKYKDENGTVHDWVEPGADTYVPQSLATGLTGGTSPKTQGAVPLTKEVNVFGTVATSAVCTLPFGLSGTSRRCVVVNDGSNALTIFPPLSAAIGSAAANASVALNANTMREFVSVSRLQWW